MSSISRLVNAKYLIKVSHITRIGIMSLFILGCNITLSISSIFTQSIVAFFVSLIASVIFGIQSAVGEVTNIGFCRGLPSYMVGYFSGGTGFSGVFGSGSILVYQAVNLDFTIIFAISIVTVFPYYFAFYWLHKAKQNAPSSVEPDQEN